jgi:TonB family protein
MNALESWLLSYLLNSLWQAPLLFVAAWIAARLARQHVAMQHRIWAGALLLEVLLPACTLDLGAALHSLWQLALHSFGAPLAEGAHVTVLTGAGYAHGTLHLSSTLLADAVIAYLGCTTYFAARLLWRLFRTSALRRASQPIALTENAQASWEQCRRAFQVPDAQLAVSTRITGPLTIGIRHRMILLPHGMLQSLPGDDLFAALAHEFAHMRRRDFAKNLFYELLSLPIAWHPLLWLTRARLAESREMVCDAMAAAIGAGRASYARSLLRLASMLPRAYPAPTLHAIGIFDAGTLERRIMNLTEKQIELRGPRRLVTAAACVAIALGTCASALTLRIGVSAPTLRTAGGTAAQHTPLHVGGSVHPPAVIRAVDPSYTEAARRAKFSGNVEVYLIVDAHGNPSHVRVTHGVGMGLDQKAIESVQQYKFKPATQNGKPVAVDLYIDVNFRMF